jgi:hypothetical protein
VAVVLFREDDAYAAAVDVVAARDPVPPHYAEEERTGAAHDSNVGQNPVAVVVLELLDNAHEERVVGHCAHCVVGDTSGHGLAHPGRVRKQRFELTVAAIVQINVYTAEVVEDEVADGVGALDGVGVVLEGLVEPLVFVLDELQAGLVGPQLVFCCAPCQTSGMEVLMYVWCRILGINCGRESI